MIMRAVDSLAVGTDDANAVLPGFRGHFRLEFFSIRPGFGKAAGHDDRRLDSRLAAFLNGSRNHPGRNYDNGQVRRVGQGRDIFVYLESQKLVGFGVDGIDGTLHSGMDEIVQDIIAEFAWGGRGPYHRHAPRFEECVQIADQIHSSSFFCYGWSCMKRSTLRRQKALDSITTGCHFLRLS